MKATLYGWFQTKTTEFRRDLLAVIGASTPQQESALSLAHAQAVARTFTAMTLCRMPFRKVNFTTIEVEAFLRDGDNLAWVDKIWNGTLERK